MAHRTRLDHAYLDFDYKRPDSQSPRLRPMFTVFRMLPMPKPETFCFERTRRGWHIIIPLGEKLKPAELVALQTQLGSDRRRECLNLMRVLAMRKFGVSTFWRGRWNILYGGKILK